jgi:hypothetical protein
MKDQVTRKQKAQVTLRLYSIKELVTEIGATEWFWRSQIWDRRIPVVQIGRKMFIDSRDIDEFIRTHKDVA